MNYIIVILIYIDDIIIIENDITVIHDVKQYLQKKFDIKDLGRLKYFLGIEIAYFKRGYFYSKENMCWTYYKK
jgi:Reverse transcriptase (RNA-dependent DNA polymerase)